MEAALVLQTQRDAVMTLTLNRPDRRNALSPALMGALIEALAQAKADPSVRALVLTGAGGHFCAGGDLGSAPGADGLLGLHDERGRFVELLRAMTELGKPIVARVEGTCKGGGLGLALACDMIVAHENAVFGTPELRVGLFPMMIMALIFRNIPRKRATEMMLTGEDVSAAQALQIGFVNRVAPTEALDAEVHKLADKVASFSPAVMRLGRDSIYKSMDMGFFDALTFLRSQLTINTMLEDAAEGIMAFLSKRKPDWKGR